PTTTLIPLLALLTMEHPCHVLAQVGTSMASRRGKSTSLISSKGTTHMRSRTYMPTHHLGTPSIVILMPTMQLNTVSQRQHQRTRATRLPLGGRGARTLAVTRRNTQ
ncbi:hypothetical protein IWW39_006138, partial [Coemansia spiralis]